MLGSLPSSCERGCSPRSGLPRSRRRPPGICVAHVKPASDAALAVEVAALAGGVDALVTRAQQLAGAGDDRLACHLIEMAVLAEPDHKRAHGARAEIYAERRQRESSLMAKGIYGFAARESEART